MTIIIVGVSIVCIPLILKLVPPNEYYGFRFPGLSENKEKWYRVNQIGGIIVILIGPITLGLLKVVHPYIDLGLFYSTLLVAFAYIIGALVTYFISIRNDD